MVDELAIWLNDERVAVIQRERSRLRLSYTPEALDRYELGLPLLSLSLPLIDEAARWGLARGRVTEIVRDLLARTPEATARARQESPDVPDHILSIIDQQLERLRSDI